MRIKLFIIGSAGLLVVAILIWSLGGCSRTAYGQGCCSSGQHGSGHSAPQPAHPMNLAMPMAQPAQQHGGGGGMMCLGSACSEPPRAEAAIDVIRWPTLLQEPAFASRRAQIEAPYRRSPPELSVPTAADYRDMAKTTQEMEAILEWFTTKGVNTRDYQQAKSFLTTLRGEASKRSQLKVDASTQAVAALKWPSHVSFAVLDHLDNDDKVVFARQQVCPVTRAKLGSMGDPIKVLVDGKPLYLCCRGCVAKAQNTPEKYLAKAHEPLRDSP
jgi:hypothetical protein